MHAKLFTSEKQRFLKSHVPRHRIFASPPHSAAGGLTTTDRGGYGLRRNHSATGSHLFPQRPTVPRKYAHDTADRITQSKDTQSTGEGYELVTWLTCKQDTSRH